MQGEVHDGGTHVSEPTDAELLRRARTDPDAFAEFCSRHVAALDRWFRGRVGAPALAADLTAETVAQALLSLRRFRDESDGSGAPWLFGIAQNLYRQYRRQERVETAARRRLGMPLRDFGGELDVVDERLTAEALTPDLDAAVAELSENQRDAVDLRIVRELPYADVAARLGCSEAVARTHVSRALTSIRKRLQGANP